MLENDVERALREESRAGHGSLRITPVESSLVSDGDLYNRSTGNSFVHMVAKRRCVRGRPHRVVLQTQKDAFAVSVLTAVISLQLFVRADLSS